MMRLAAFVASTLAVAGASDDQDPCSSQTLLHHPELKRGSVHERVLVTGGAGFVGSHVVELLLDLGYLVRVVDDLTVGSVEWLPLQHPHLEFIFGNTTDKSVIMQAAKDVEGIFHLSEHTEGAASARDPAGGTLSIEQNVLGTAVVLEAAHKMRVHKVLLASNAAVYGDHQQVLAEDTALVGQTPYAVSKQMAERIMEMYDALYDVRTVSLRLFNVYGPRQPTSAKQAGVVAKFLDLARQNKPVTIEGEGEQVRDFVHVKDVARAFVLAFDANVRGEHVNVGSGKSVTINQLAGMISASKAHLPRRGHDGSVVVSNTCKAKRLLHFHAEHVLAGSVAEYKENPAALTKPAPFWSQPETIEHMNHQIMERIDGQLFVWSNMTMDARTRLLRKALSRESKFLRHVFMAIKEKRHEEL
mmetsp:Transcript_25845/g.66659  ORF Transcript_25845/g.66659 Transcript_25845/m.66659 type:complete len:415 (-) Transcript_25845:159-1403(-)